MRYTLIIAAFALCLPALSFARAQTVDISLLDDDFGTDFMESFEHITNPYLADSIKLHYQITLLEKMTARQAELVKIKASFDALGIPFEEPAPSYTLCSQLPPNTPCLRHYPQLYTDLVQSRQRHYADLMAQQAMEGGVNLVALEGSGMDASRIAAIDPAILERSRKEEAARKKREEEARLARLAEERKTRYHWSEVTCVVGQCSGVIRGQNNFRATVRDGTRLPDGTMVADISRTGISVIIDGERIALRPSPVDAPISLSPTDALTLDISDRVEEGPAAASRGQSGDDEYTPPGGGSNRTTSILNNAGTRNANNLPPVNAQGANQNAQNAPASVGGGGGATVVEPALGPSGLF